VRQFIENKLEDVGRCLRTIAKEVVEKNAPDAAKAAKECVRRFGNLGDSEAELREEITVKCAPGQPEVTHTLADVLGTGVPGVAEPLHAANLGAYCAHFGGDGSVDSLAEWLDCLAAASECAADTALAVTYPRGLEWLALVRPAMLPIDKDGAVAALDQVSAAIDGTPAGDLKPDIRCGPAGGDLVAVFPGDGVTAPALSYTDNGDLTTTDNNTQFMWEQKLPADDAACTAASQADRSVHCVQNTYTWSSTGTAADGTAFTDFLARLNNRCANDETVDCTANGDADCTGVGGTCGFAGYRDWGMPDVRKLQSIVDYGVFNPAIATTFPGAIAAASYWSSTSLALNPPFAWVVNFTTGSVGLADKDNSLRVRAVRGDP
jgi:hypothetical protein